MPSTLTTQHGGFYINCGLLDFKEISDDEILAEDEVKKKLKKRKNQILVISFTRSLGFRIVGPITLLFAMISTFIYTIFFQFQSDDEQSDGRSSKCSQPFRKKVKEASIASIHFHIDQYSMSAKMHSYFFIR